MRRFTAEYLETTRDGMWDDSREALTGLGLGRRQRVLDVGAGTGELTSVLREEVPGTVSATDIDRELLAHTEQPRVLGDATQLPFDNGSFGLVICQALLVNLPDPAATVREFARVSTDCVAVVEPDNSAVTVDSTVERESRLAATARELYFDGIDTDPTVGDARALFTDAGIEQVTVRRYDHRQRVAPPYTEQALEAARRKASGAGIERDRGAILAGETTAEAFDSLREQWRAMGRDVIKQMQNETYRREEVVPFYVTSGTVSES